MEQTRLVEAYSDLVRKLVQDGCSCNLLSFTFPQLPGTRPILINSMKDRVQGFYETLLPRVHRRPRTAPISKLPILIGAADLPVKKSKRSTAPLVACNDGLHFHAILLIPRVARLKEPLAVHLDRHSGLYGTSGRVFQSIHVKLVVEDYGRVVDYVLKNLTNGRIAYDDGILILPRARQELS